MNYNIRFRRQSWKDCYVANFMGMVVDKIIEKYPEHSFEILRDISQENNGYGSISSPLNFSLLNPENGKYIVVSAIDNWKNHLMKHLGWEPEKMVKMFYSGGFSFLEYFSLPQKWKVSHDIRNIYRPFYYGPYDHRHQDLITELYNNRNPSSTDLVFRGLLFPFRQSVAKHIEDPDIKVVCRRSGGTNLEYTDYLRELSEHTAALSLPGATEICNRDIECFAVGTPVLRPLIHTQYPDPLVPDYHYVNFYLDCYYSDTGNPGYKHIEDFGKYLSAKWNQIKKNTEFLKFVSENARAWYLKNCQIENNVNYLVSQIRLEDING